MSLSLTRQPWMDAPVAPHPVADANAATVRPRDLAAPPQPKKAAPWLRPRTLSIVLAGHAALLLVAALTWRAVLPAGGETTEEIPVEIVIEATSDERLAVVKPSVPATEAAQEQIVPQSVLDAVAAAISDPPAESAAHKSERMATIAQEAAATPPPERLAAAPSDDASPPETAASMQARAAQAEQERREAVARQRATRLAQERAARAAEERADMERERRAQAKRAAERERHAQAIQERRRIAARSLGAQQTRPTAPAFDAAGYRAVVARTVAAATSRSCSAGGGGRVVVALMIGPSGRVAGASLSSASGNSILDAAALSAVRRAGPFPAPSNGASVSVPIVVICR